MGSMREQQRDALAQRLSLPIWSYLMEQEALDAQARTTATTDYSLLTLRNALQSSVPLGKGCALTLRGHELIVVSPVPCYIRFGIGHLWIHDRLIVCRSYEQAYHVFRHLLEEALPVAMAVFISGEQDVGREYLKQLRLLAINAAARMAAKQENDKKTA